MTGAEQYPKLTDEFFESDEFRKIQAETLDYWSQVSNLDSGYRHPVVNDEQLEALKKISGSPEALAALDFRQQLVGRAVISAAELEISVSDMAIAFLVPKDPLKYAEYFLKLTAFERSHVLRQLTKSIENSHWRRLWNLVQEEAVFRNDLVHGNWEHFTIDDDGEVRAGWFLKNRKKRSRGPWYVRRVEVTVQTFQDHYDRTEALMMTVEAVRYHLALWKRLTGEILPPRDLFEVFERSPFQGVEQPHLRAVRRKIFPVLK